MDNIYNNSISDFLSETEQYIEQIDDLTLETAAELYDLLDDAAQAATVSIKEIDPEQRVTICNWQDIVLERIVDELPPFDNSGSYSRIFSPAMHFSKRWDNVELMKDCGLVGYMLSQEINATPVMFFGTKPEDYPYLSILPQMEMIYNDSDPELADAYIEHLKSSYKEMDILLFYGMYTHSVGYLNKYRNLRPDGKVYCGLDMNSFWMETTPWNSKPARGFAKQCDIIATSCRQMRDALNRRPDVHFPCRWFTNGFYNPTGVPVIADPELKENVILTVGRIGTYQKNNEELLTAFAAASGVLEGWSLRFVGTIEPEFHSYIDNYFIEHPYLKDKVIFTGPIADKVELYNEYAKAKVFALTSRQEGGTPNVYAEALHHGCKFVASDFDAADDITNYGQLGAKYRLGDIDALHNALIEVCSGADKDTMRNYIPIALKHAAKYYDWSRNAKKLAYMLFN